MHIDACEFAHVCQGMCGKAEDNLGKFSVSTMGSVDGTQVIGMTWLSHLASLLLLFCYMTCEANIFFNPNYFPVFLGFQCVQIQFCNILQSFSLGLVYEIMGFAFTHNPSLHLVFI